MSKIADQLIEKSETLTEETLGSLKPHYSFNNYQSFKNCLLDKALEFVNDDPGITYMGMIIDCNGTMILDYDGTIIGKLINREVF